MTTQRIFVSHSHEDNGFCHKLVEALGTTSTDVWFDEQKLGPGQLLLTIERELRACPIFVVILSPAALASDWVRDESSWAYILQWREPHRVILPVLAQPVDANAIWLFLQGFKRIEAPGGLPLTAAEAGRQTLRAITLPLSNPAVEQQKHVHDGSSGALLARARALYAGNRHAEALAVLDRAAQLSSGDLSPAALALRAHTLNRLGQPAEALAAADRALALRPNGIEALLARAEALLELRRFKEALTAAEHALDQDPTQLAGWVRKAEIHSWLGEFAEMLVAADRAQRLDGADMTALAVRGIALSGLHHTAEARQVLGRALGACDRALAQRADDGDAWIYKGAVLAWLGKYGDALAAYEHALALLPGLPSLWIDKARMLRQLGRTHEAEAAEARATILTSA